MGYGGERPIPVQLVSETELRATLSTSLIGRAGILREIGKTSSRGILINAREIFSDFIFEFGGITGFNQP